MIAISRQPARLRQPPFRRHALDRIAYLVQNGVSADGIRALMYNTAAKDDFAKKLEIAGLSTVKVQTFHSLGYAILTWATRKGHLPKQRLVSEDRERTQLVREAMKAAREDGHQCPVRDTDLVLNAISTWKAMLTPPEEAGHLQDESYVAVYRHFERLRCQAQLITFDDQIYDAVRLLEREDSVRDRLANLLEHLIIDEFQDVNHARLRLAKILAGTRARVMVVGDDDQCIYEWQGARSSFIKRGFQTEFANFPHSTYKLTRSFRFGPAIAQLAANVIAHNTDRVEKDLVADDLTLPASITLSTSASGGDRQALPAVSRLLEEGAAPSNIVVLVRKYSQSFLVQSLFLARNIPFFVEGERPLHDAYPVTLALRYLAAASTLDSPMNPSMGGDLDFVVHRPPRWVTKEAFATVLRLAVNEGITPAAVLTERHRMTEAGVSAKGIGSLAKLEQDLRAARDSSADETGLLSGGLSVGARNAGTALEVLLDRVAFSKVFESFEGPTAVEDDLAVMRSMAFLLREANIGLSEAQDYVAGLDTRRGEPDERCVKITTIFKAKGLEWDHVFLPDLIDGQCPDVRGTSNVCVNRKHPHAGLDTTHALEGERRLFYVAITRAKRSVCLLANPDDKRLISRFVHEAFVDETTAAVEALQAMLVDGDAVGRKFIDRMAQGASADERLRDGLMKMLRLAAQDAGPRAARAVEQATVAVNRVAPVAFSYPHAYTESSKPREGSGGLRTGLPF